MMNKTKDIVLAKKLAEINILWCEYEKNMGENAALAVACEQHGVDSQWFYDNLCKDGMPDLVNNICTKYWGNKDVRKD